MLFRYNSINIQNKKNSINNYLVLVKIRIEIIIVIIHIIKTIALIVAQVSLIVKRKILRFWEYWDV